MGNVKNCPKCQGNVFVEWDYGSGDWYEYCLQCSYRHYLPAMVTAKDTPVKQGKRGKRSKDISVAR